MCLKFVVVGNCSESVFVASVQSMWAGHVAQMGEKRNAYRLLVGKPEGRRPLGRRRRKWLDGGGMG
jgi:hypothetical protein